MYVRIHGYTLTNLTTSTQCNSPQLQSINRRGRVIFSTKKPRRDRAIYHLNTNTSRPLQPFPPDSIIPSFTSGAQVLSQVHRQMLIPNRHHWVPQTSSPASSTSESAIARYKARHIRGLRTIGSHLRSRFPRMRCWRRLQLFQLPLLVPGLQWWWLRVRRWRR